jgi:hypothetical protein
MRFRLTFITGMSLLLLVGGLYLAFADADGYVGKRFFFIMVGILGWFIGNKLVELDERLADVEKALTERTNTGGPAELGAASDRGRV